MSKRILGPGLVAVGLALIVWSVALAGRGTLTISSVTDNGDGSYTLTVASSTGVTVGDHLGARITSTTGPGGLWEVMSVPSGVSVIVSDTLTEEQGSAYGVPIAGSGWYSTPTATTGFSKPPHTAVGYDAALRRNAHRLGTISTQAASGVAITGGTITGITDLAVADGGTGASTAADARTNLGLGTISTQAASAVAITGGSVTGITDLAVADGGTGASTAGDARTNLGLGTISTQDASAVAITGGSVTGITDLTVADGGTGSSTANGARTNLGVAIGTNVQAWDNDLDDIAALTPTKGRLLVGDGTDWVPVTVGADGEVLHASSGAASGVAWDTDDGAAGGAHAMLSSTHTDADGAGDTPVRGDIIVVGSGSTFTRLPLGATNTVISSDGTDTKPQTITALLDAAFGSTRGMYLTRGASSWEVLSVGAANTVLKSDGTDPGYGTLTALLDSAIGSTQGSVLYRGASAWSALTPGTAGQVLHTNGAGSNPTWDTDDSGAGDYVTLHTNVTEATSMTYTIPGGTVSADGDVVEIELVGATDNSGETARLVVGGTTVFDTVVATTSFGVTLRIVRTGSTTFRYDGTFRNGTTVTGVFNAVLTEGSATWASDFTITADFSTSLDADRQIQVLAVRHKKA